MEREGNPWPVQLSPAIAVEAPDKGDSLVNSPTSVKSPSQHLELIIKGCFKPFVWGVN